jgi:hypothetical protein
LGVGTARCVYGMAAITANEVGALDIYGDEIQPDTGWLREEDIGQRKPTVNFRDGRWLDKPILRSILKADPRFEGAEILKTRVRGIRSR